MFLDIAIGILGAILFATATNINLSLSLIASGIFFSLLPDIDFVFHALRRNNAGRFAHEHRDLLHYPLLYLPVIFMLTIPFGLAFAIFATGISLVHFLHDCIGVGWGIKWLFPFSKRSYKFFCNGKIVTSWTPEALVRQVANHGDDHWIKNTYLRPTKILLLEISVLLLAMIAVAIVLIAHQVDS